jgi:hypothetical protein
MKTYGGGGGCIDPRFLNFGTSWRWVVSFTLRPLYPRGSSPRYPLDRWPGRFQSRPGRYGKVEILDSSSGPLVVLPVASCYRRTLKCITWEPPLMAKGSRKSVRWFKRWNGADINISSVKENWISSWPKNKWWPKIRQLGWTSDRGAAVRVAVDLGRYGAESYWGRGWEGGRRRWPGILLLCDTRSICMLLRAICSFSRSLCVYLLSDINDVLHVHSLSTFCPQQINANTVFYCCFGVTTGSLLIYVGNIRRWARREAWNIPLGILYSLLLLLSLFYYYYHCYY